MASDEKCGICGGVLGTGAWSTYSPYPRHADMSICTRNIRLDERERIAQAIEAHAEASRRTVTSVAYGNGVRHAYGDAARIARNRGGSE